MEDVLEVYHRPYNPNLPVVCMDESNKQLVGQVTEPIPCSSGHPLLEDDEYIRNGVADIFMAVEPLAGKRHISITETRKRLDWAIFMKDLLDTEYKECEKVVLVMDNLNTHTMGSFYEAFAPEEARRLTERLEVHYTPPKHGSWLNMAEIELSVLKSQCLDRRISDMATITEEVLSWEHDRNNKNSKIDWQFQTNDARIKLKRLYPTL
jgi:hypothetical protein